MAKLPSELSELLAAAVAFDEQLRRFARVASIAMRDELDSQKHLERTAAALREAVEVEESLMVQARTLAMALSAARNAQEEQSRTLQERAAVVGQRTDTFNELIARYQAIGEEAASISELARQVTANARDAGSATIVSLEEVEQRLGHAVDRARTVAQDARDASFPEVAEQIHSLQQRLSAAVKQVAQVRRALAMKPPSGLES